MYICYNPSGTRTCCAAPQETSPGTKQLCTFNEIILAFRAVDRNCSFSLWHTNLLLAVRALEVAVIFVFHLSASASEETKKLILPLQEFFIFCIAVTVFSGKHSYVGNH